MHKQIIAGILALVSLTTHAEGTLFKVPTRDGVVTTLVWEAAPDAKATVFLFPGGGGGFGKFEDGKATGGTRHLLCALCFMRGERVVLIK